MIPKNMNEIDITQLAEIETSYNPPPLKITDFVDITVKYEDLLEIVDPENFEKFTGSLMVIFDVDPEILMDLANYDYLWRPEIHEKGFSLNYIQQLTSDKNGNFRCPINELFSFLFTNTEPYCNEKYIFTQRQKTLRIEHLKKIMTKYGGVKKYFEEVSKRLWRDDNYLSENWPYFVDVATKLIKRL